MSLLFSFLLLVSFTFTSAAISATYTTLTIPSPLSPTVHGNVSNRQVCIVIQGYSGFTILAKDGSNVNVGTGGALFTVELYSTSPSCVPSAATPTCSVVCAPYKKPNTIAPQCASSAHATNSSGPKWASGVVTDNGDGLYFVTYYPEYKGNYDISIFLATQGGLRGYYFDNVWFLNTPTFIRIDPQVSFQWGTGVITTYGANYVGIRWVGKIRSDYSELYTLYLNVDDNARLWIDKTLVIDTWKTCCNETWGSVLLTAGSLHDIIIEYKQLRGVSFAELRWSSVTVPKQLVPSLNLYYIDHIKDSPFTNVTVYAGDPPATNFTYAYGTGLSGSTAGILGAFTVQTVDIFNNTIDRISSLASWTYSISGPDSSPTKSLTYVSNGTYSGVYNISKSGVYSMAIKLSGIDIVGSPFYFSIVPSYTIISQTYVYGYGLAGTGVAQTSNSFIVQARDYLSNNVTGSYDIIGLVFTGPAPIPYFVDGSLVPGQYLVVYTPQIAGTYTMAVQINGTSVPSSPYNLVVTPSSVYSLSCYVYSFTSATENSTASATSFLTLYTRDYYNNSLTSGGLSVTFSMVGISGPALVGGTPTPTVPAPSVVSASITDLSSGIYTISYLPTISGRYRMHIYVSGADIQGSPFIVTVSPGPVIPSLCIASGSGASSSSYQTSGVQSEFRVTVYDLAGNIPNDSQINGTFTISSTLVCSGTTVNMDSVAFLGSGIFLLAYTPTKSGSCNLNVLWAGASGIYGSPFGITVVPGKPSVLNSTLTGSNLNLITAGVTGSFVINAFDAAGNHLTVGNSPFWFNITSSVSPYVSLAVNATTTTTTSLTSNGNGVYTGVYTMLIAGSYLLNIWLSSVGGLLGTYYRTPQFDVKYFSRVDATINFNWGVSSVFPDTIFPADYFSVIYSGNILPPLTDTYRIYVSISSNVGIRLMIDGKIVLDQFAPLSLSYSQSSEPFVDVILNSGTYFDIKLFVNATTGAASVALKWSSSTIPKSIIPSSVLYSVDLLNQVNHVLTVVPSAISASTSSIVNALPTFVAGNSATFTIQARDVYGNLRINSSSDEASNFAATLTGVPSISGTIKELCNGMFNVTLVPNSGGSQVVSVTYSGSNIAGFPRTTTVVKGISYAPNCVLSIQGLTSSQLPTSIPIPTLSSTTAGLFTLVLVSAFDIRNNSITSGGDLVTMSATATFDGVTTSIHGIVTDNNDGTYMVNYTGIVAGTYTASFLINGAHIASSPITIVIAPSIVSATYTRTVSIQSSVTAGSDLANYFTLVAYDSYQNLISAGSSYFVVKTNNYDSNSHGAVTNLNNGNFTVQYNLTSVGSWYVRVYAVTGYYTSVNGLLGKYYNNRWLQGTPVLSRVDRTINLNWGTDLITPTAASYVSIQWSGYIRPYDAGNHTFYLNAADGGRVYINGYLVLDSWKLSVPVETIGYITFPQGNVLYDITVQFRHSTGNAYATLSWSSLSFSKEVVPAAALYSSATEISGSPFTVTAA